MDFENVTEILICPVCQDVALPPIYQCGKGHLICHNCIPLLQDNLCPTCRATLPGERIRALALEQLANTIEVKCKHWSKGCRVTYRLENIDKHLETCIYEEISLCQLFGSKCKAQVSCADFSTHCFKAHADSTQKLEDFDNSIPICQSVILEDLIQTHANNTDNKSYLVWRPYFLVAEQQIYVILSKYVGSTKSFRWTVVTWQKSDANDGAGVSARANSANANSESVEIIAKPSSSYSDHNPQNKMSWYGGVQDLAKFKENNTSSNQIKNVNPNFTFSLPLGYLVDAAKLLENGGPSSLGNSLVIKWNLFVNIGANPNPTTLTNSLHVIDWTSLTTTTTKGRKKAVPKPKVGKNGKKSEDSSMMKQFDSQIYQKVIQGSSTEKSATIQVFPRICDICGATPIQDIVFSCITCPGFDVCHSCTKLGYHNEHILVRKRFPEIRTPVPVPASQTASTQGMAQCDACGSPISGVRYKCCVCVDLDICEKCEEKGFHSFHWCARTTASIDPATLNSAISATVLGTNVSTGRANFAICLGRGRGRPPMASKRGRK